MLETALVLAVIGVLGVAGAVPAMAVSSLVTLAGIAVLAMGLAVGLPAGLWYHVILYRFVSPRVRVPRAWWLSPLTLHRHLTDAERHRIALWYRIGGVGFALSVAGGLAAIGGLLAR